MVAFFGMGCPRADEHLPGSSRARQRRVRQQRLAKALTRRASRFAASNPLGRAIPGKAAFMVAFFGMGCPGADEHLPGSSRARQRRARQQRLAKALTRRASRFAASNPLGRAIFFSGLVNHLRYL